MVVKDLKTKQETEWNKKVFLVYLIKTLKHFNKGICFQFT